MVYSHNGIPHNNENEETECNNVDKFHKAEQKRQDKSIYTI